MIFCNECFCDVEIRAEIEMADKKGTCPICGRSNVWLYDSETDGEKSNVNEYLTSLLDLYIPESDLPIDYPEDGKVKLESGIKHDWNIFSGSEQNIRTLLDSFISESDMVDSRLLTGRVGIPQLYDKDYLNDHSILGQYDWKSFTTYMRNENRFYNRHINQEVLQEYLEDARLSISRGEKFFRGRVAGENGNKGIERKNMGAPPEDKASPGRANSKGQSCLYLCSDRDTTIKEIRASAFDYVTIATFKTIRDINVIDLSSITHATPFYEGTNLLSFLINEPHLRNMENDLARPMSRWDSDLDYLPTQYISDYARYLRYDGVAYYSTFNKDAYNLALFDVSACKCIYSKTYLVEELEYKTRPVKKGG